MADFSIFMGPSAEWLALEATIPPQPVQTVEEMQKSVNNAREDTAAQEMINESTYIIEAACPDRIGLPYLGIPPLTLRPRPSHSSPDARL